MNSLADFISRFDDFSSWKQTIQVDYVAYYLTSFGGNASVSGGDIEQAFRDLDLKQYKRVSSYLSENASASNGKYVKIAAGGYKLERGRYSEIDRVVKQEPAKVSVSTKLTNLVEKVPDGSEKDFLQEAINCYRIEAYRAFIIMVWIVAMDHMQRLVFANHLTEFNLALSKSPDKKVKKIINYDDFSDLNESKLIELMRSAGVISNDVRKLLDEKLGTRNSAAHPSGIKISDHKATEFALDVVDNVLLKY